MTEEAALSAVSSKSPELRGGVPTWQRVLRYAALRTVMLFITVVIGVYLTVLIANMGGYVDEIRRAQIREQVAVRFQNDLAFRALPPEERQARIEAEIQKAEKRLGLDKPFVVRSFIFLRQALALDLGRAENMTSDSGSRQVRLIILERLPATLLLFGTSALITFLFSLSISLYLSRNYGNPLDRFFVSISPLSSAPGWFFAVFLIAVFAAWLKVLPFGGMISTPPPETTLEYILDLGKHLILPIIAQILTALPIGVYSWRTFFLIYSKEDYVEVAKAKGLPSRVIERRYILRPTMPTIITSFALTLIAVWLGQIIFETVMNWPGLGRTYYQAIGVFDTAVIVGITVLYAYLLALTVFLLDIIYAIVDPRVDVGGVQSAA